MEKISNEQFAEVLRDASTTLRMQQSLISDLEEKLASRDRRDRVEKVASEMHRKGINLETPIETLADNLEKAAEQGKLDAIEQGVSFVGPDMGEKIGQAAHNTNQDAAGTPGSSDLERFIVGGVG
jgi:hypothetical protein